MPTNPSDRAPHVKVLSVWPKAESFNLAPYVCGIFFDPDGDKPDGVGITEDEAWTNAWERNSLQDGPGNPDLPYDRNTGSVIDVLSEAPNE